MFCNFFEDRFINGVLFISFEKEKLKLFINFFDIRVNELESLQAREIG